MSLPLAAAAATVADVNKTTLSLLWAIKAGKVSGRRSEHRRVVGAEPHAAGHTEAPHCHASATFEAEIGRGTRAGNERRQNRDHSPRRYYRGTGKSSIIPVGSLFGKDACRSSLT
jgi:hypothetical protein